jgi:hypothetical protein
VLKLPSGQSDQPQQIASEEAESWRVAMNAAYLLREHFPDFYRVHVAHRETTLAGGLGLCCAFWQLMEDVYHVELRWPEDHAYIDGYTIRDGIAVADPVEWLGTFDDVSEEWMSSNWFWLNEPRPVYYGLGVQAMTSGDLGPPGLLLLLLWHLFSHTDLSVGAGLLETIYGQTEDEDILDLMRLRWLNTWNARELLVEVAAHIPEAQHLPEPSALLRYCFGNTGNPLADTSIDEMIVVHGGEDYGDEWSWSDMETLARRQQEAKAISEAYIAWRDRIEFEGMPALRKLAALIHRCARRFQRAEKQRDNRLITLLGSDVLEAAEAINVEAL